MAGQAGARLAERFWDQLTDAEQADLTAIGRQRLYPTDTVVSHEGDVSGLVLVVLDGWAKSTTATPEGRNVLFRVDGPGALLQEEAVFRDEPRPHTVTSLTPLKTLVMSSSRFRTYLDAHPRVSRLIIRQVLRRLDMAERRISDHQYGDAVLRLASLLIYLAELSRDSSPALTAGGKITLPPLAQAEIGSWVDASRETTARAFRELRERGLVQTGWRKITVLDLDGLRVYTAERVHRLAGWG